MVDDILSKIDRHIELYKKDLSSHLSQVEDSNSRQYLDKKKLITGKIYSLTRLRKEIERDYKKETQSSCF